MKFKSKIISVSLIANLTIYPLVIPNAFASDYNAICDQVGCFVKLDDKGIKSPNGFMPYEGVSSWTVAEGLTRSGSNSYYSFIINGYDKEGYEMSHSFDIDKKKIMKKIMKKLKKNSGLSMGEDREVNVYEIMGYEAPMLYIGE